MSLSNKENIQQTKTSSGIINKFLQKCKQSKVIHRLSVERWLYIMLIPGLIYFIIFKYLPMWGVVIAFKDYEPFLGFLGSKWVGIKHFERFFTTETFWMLFRNTLMIGFYNLVFFFPFPIILALMLNEVRHSVFKRVVQTMTYVPHFVSWVVVVGITYVFFTTEGGIVNEIISATGKPKINFLMEPNLFRPMIISQSIWKETGWGTIIFLASLAGIDPQLYEAATIDGAGRWKQMYYITLPSIRSTVILLLILRLGNFLDTGFEQIYLMLNAMNRSVGEVFDTYVYTSGILGGQFSYSTAVGLFKSVVGLTLVVFANTLAKRVGEEGIY